MKYSAIFQVYGLIMANLLLIMGGQLGYLYIVGPISMEEGNTMSLPEIPFIGFLIMILMAAGSMIIVAILQKMPAPVRYVTSNLKPYTKKIEKIIGRKSKNDLSPRVIDIDIIFYGERKVHRKNLILPHNNFANRPFVIVPINELDKKMKMKLTKKFKNFLIYTNISSKLSGNIVQKVS